MAAEVTLGTRFQVNEPQLKGNENWFEKSGVRNIGSKLTVKRIQGKRLLV